MSWSGVILASLVTFGIILTLGGVMVAILEVLGLTGAAEGSAISGLVGISLTLLLAFFLGGYVAGRTASRSRVKHSLLASLLALVVAMFLAVVGTMLMSGFVNGLSGVRLPSTLDDVHNLGTSKTISGVLALILPFVGGAMGGTQRAKMGRRRRP